MDSQFSQYFRLAGQTPTIIYSIQSQVDFFSLVGRRDRTGHNVHDAMSADAFASAGGVEHDTGALGGLQDRFPAGTGDTPSDRFEINEGRH
jgi:hypothetical protein